MDGDPAVDAAIAVRRFGLGARPGEVARRADPRGWLTEGLDRPERFRLEAPGLPDVRAAGRALAAFREASEAPREEGGGKPGELLQAAWLPDLEARFARALDTEDGFAERLVWFWSNHFTVSTQKAACAPFVGVFEREVIRGHLAGRFEDLLVAAVRHPAMLIFLDQVRSVGPDSAVGERRELGLNENLAREILELHTLGVDGGYTQADVLELARALTGFTVMRPQLAGRASAELGEPIFLEASHEPGARTVLGQTFPEGGQDQAVAVLRALARHPSTARHLARKLVRHWVADDPPPAAVAAVERAFLESGGDLPTVHRALVEAPEAWEPTPRKLLTPVEFVVAALRAVELRRPGRELGRALAAMGQPVYRASSPAGWPDTAAEWGGPDALMKRLELCGRLAAEVDLRRRPEEWLADVCPLASEPTRTAVARAASAPQALVLALMSPEFQRR